MNELLNDSRRTSSKTVLRPASRIPEKSVKDAQPAIHMDFGNYTIGRLVSGRGNYDYTHKDYVAVRRRIERRILDLGYDPERFRHADGAIAQASFYSRQSNDGQKTDRYGKKYSWVAFYEVAGRLALRGRMTDRWEARLSDTDIDPSFPSAPLEWQPPLKDVFAQPFTKTAHWLQHGSSPSYGDLLVLDTVDGHIGPWVLLDGFASQAAAADHRRTFTFLRGVLVKQKDISRLQKAVKNTEYPGNRAIPEPHDDHYLFAGEIGWSDKYGCQPSGRVALPHVDEAFEGRETSKVTKRFADLSPIELMGLTGSFRIVLGDDDPASNEETEYAPDDLVTVDEYKKIPGVKVEVPVRHFAWESYHSQENQGGTSHYPAPALVRSLNLRKFGSQVDMFDQHGGLATIYRDFNPESYDSRSRFLYMRADMLEEYLKRGRTSLVWINWGEREMDHRVAEGLRDDPEVQALWGKHTHIHKECFVYDPAKRRPENKHV